MPRKEIEEEIIDNSLIDGEPESDAPVEDNSRVSMKGEEIPDTVDNLSEELVDTTEPSEAPEPEGEPESTNEERSEFEKRFYELGLDKQFKGGPDEMLRRIPDMNRYITDLERQRNLYRNQLEGTPRPEEPKAPSPDDFYNDPINAIDKIINSRMSTLNNQIADLKVQTFIASKPDYPEMEPLMVEQLHANPGLKALGIDAYPVLYQMAKATQLDKVAREAAKKAPVTVPNKSAAESTVGKKTASPPIDSVDYWRNKTPKEIEQELGFSGD